MDRAIGWRWQRLLLCLAVLAGLSAMHSVVWTCPDEHPQRAIHATLVDAGSPPDARTPEVMTDLVGGLAAMRVNPPTPDSGSILSCLLHLCLAVLTALILLGLPTLVGVLMSRRARHGRQVRGDVICVLPRPPPRMAVRLAQLCVLRN